MVQRETPSRRRRRRILVAALIISDFVSILLAGLIASWLWFGSVTIDVAFEQTEAFVVDMSFLQLSLIVAPLWIGMMVLGGLYDPDRWSWGGAEIGSIARSLSMGVVVVIFGTYLAKTPGLSRGWTLLTWVLSIILVAFGRGLIHAVIYLMRRRGMVTQPTLVVGSNAESSDIIRVLRANRAAGLVPVGCLASSLAEKLDLDYCSENVPVLGTARDIIQILQSHEIDTVIIASSAFDHDVLARMIAELRDVDVDVHISSGLFEVLTSRILVSEVAGVPLITVKGISLSRSKRLTKRVFDLALAGAIVLIGLPVWVLIALLIKLGSPGPVLYGQPRVGRNGTRFQMLKFRSMYRDADQRLADLQAQNEASGPLFKMKNDPRVTPVGKWLRKFSLDEFPQLINVLKGEMSLVGPRPPLPLEVERYTRHDWRRLEVTPGMTGLWQVSGRSSLTFDEMVRLDLFYIENWSVGLDIQLILRTLPAVLFARGAY